MGGSSMYVQNSISSIYIVVLLMCTALVGGGSTAGWLAIVHFGSVGRLWGLFERSKAT